MGNICRSPLAEGIFRHKLNQCDLESLIYVDSAGTHATIGKPPDKRSQEVAACRGLNIDYIRSRKVQKEDLQEFDYILAMDKKNQLDLLSICPSKNLENSIQLFMLYAPFLLTSEIPDPYFSNQDGFELVANFIEIASEGLLNSIRHKYSI